MREVLPATVGIELEFSRAIRSADELRDEVYAAAETPIAPAPVPAQIDSDENTTSRPRLRVLDDIEMLMVGVGYQVHNHNGYRLSPVSATHWDLKTDSSCGYEAASPVIGTYTDLVRHARVGSIIQSAGCQVTDSCGLHVHVGVQDLSATQLESLLKLCLRYELAFHMLIPPRRRRGTYCRGTSDDLAAVAKDCFKSARNLEAVYSRLAELWGNKHTWLNCKPLSRQKTVEFRFMCGSLDPTFIVSYVLFLLHVVDTAANGRPGRWGRVDARSSPLLFRSFLGAAGFYKPLSETHDPDRAAIGRKWATRWARLQHPEPTVPVVEDRVGPSRSPSTQLIGDNPVDVSRIIASDINQMGEDIDAEQAIEAAIAVDANRAYANGDVIDVRLSDGSIQQFRVTYETGRLSSRDVSLQAVPRSSTAMTPVATNTYMIAPTGSSTTNSTIRVSYAVTTSNANLWNESDIEFTSAAEGTATEVSPSSIG